jgi:ATP-binding cassette, subfamily B, multidrug efflux pump
MKQVLALSAFLKPYQRHSLAALLLLTLLVVADLSIPRLVQRIIDQGIHRQDQSLVINTGLIMLGISLCSTLLAIGNNVLSVHVGEGLNRDLREALFRKIQTFSFANIDRLSTGQLMVRLASDTRALQRLALISLRIGTRAPLMMVGSLALMIHTSPSLALTLLPLLLVTLGVIAYFIRRMEPLFRRVQEKLDVLNTVLQENIAGIRLVKAFVREDFEQGRFQVTNDDYTADSTRVMRFMAVMAPALTVCVNIGMVIVIWQGGIGAIQGDVTIGQIVAFTNYLLTLMAPLIMMVMLSNVWANGIASAGRINDVLETTPTIIDRPDAAEFDWRRPAEIVFDNVTFQYDGQKSAPVLQNIRLTVEAGQTVAILGATGSGKSTLVNLVPRFYDVTDGSICIGGQDIRSVQQNSLLAGVAIVPQDVILFSGSLRDNICYGRPGAPDEEMIEAAQAAQAHGFISALPRGYNSHIEERGVNLSGGQKQRISIARALLTKARILILDDATSAVDIDTETRIQAALENRPDPPTVLLVAQRISTVLRADKIVVIEKGRIVAEGSHSELLETSRIYQEIYHSQLGDGVGFPSAWPAAQSV